VPKHSVFFKSDNIQVEVDAGTDLLTASHLAKLDIQCVCGGEGTCSKCLIRVISGSVQTTTVRHGDLSVACQTRVVGDVIVEIPPESRLAGDQVVMGAVPELPLLFHFDPLCKKVCLQLNPPTLNDPSSDASRLLMALRQYTGRDGELDISQMRTMADILRSSNWNVDVTYIEIAKKAIVISIDSHNPQARLLGIAVDVGTTTVVAYLVDLLSGSIIGQAGTHNRQAQFGGDVITRIIHASDESCGLAELQTAVIETINYLIEKLVDKNQIDIADIRVIVTAGNTTMAHLLLGIQPRYIRLEPYVPAASQFPVVKAKELGLKVHPTAVVFSFPAVASYVGGDIVAGVLVNGMATEEPLTLFMDIGTNGEMVLGNQEWLVSCSCSAGTAFEGAGITCGMRAMQGAIERLTIDPHTFAVQYTTIGETSPLGICGSGLINALAEMRKAGIIDRAGKMQDVSTLRSRRSDGGKEFVLVWADVATGGRDIVITEADVKSLLRTKGAIYAGMRSLLKSVDLDMASIERVYIAGGFGSYLNIADAVEIGLLPDLGSAKYRFLGNTSINGALTVLISSAALGVAERLAESITYVELSAGNLFMEEFISALFLPHTDLNLFPSVGS
jgi:uncharacterized 2Fe-2S/4Fe-4S cluster protein (DUF4445 family)